ncbi:MAG: glycoside hydrolase family 127 protein [Spirochaetes bacterium]|nr:glycoside hydrolase family 127 protein [Spirochaetota bacterium]
MGINKLINKNYYTYKPVSFSDVKISGSFWGEVLERHQRITIRDCLSKLEKYGRVENFRKAAKKEGDYDGIYFNDSDVYKVLEGVAYTLINNYSPDLEKTADELIEIIATAQMEDGYLNCYFILSKTEERWTDMERHEDYCLGHMIEAAVAYEMATGKKRFLEISERMVENMMSFFSEGKKNWVPGHQEIELALVKLYHATGKIKYLDYSYWLLEQRGHGYGVGKNLWGVEKWGAKYAQDDRPVSEMTDIAGHAVRAMYMYTAMGDILFLRKRTEYMEAMRKLWESVVLRNMYITGGIGSTKENEGFTEDFDLPNDTAYCETCASVGMVYWNHRMNLLTGESRFADVIEREMYNGILSGLSYDGTGFFYVNPLESDGSHHRQEWYDVSCCPTQLARFIPSIGDYVFTSNDEGIWINQYLQCSTDVRTADIGVSVKQETDYPWFGNVRLTVSPDKQEEFSIYLRKPEWCNSILISINGENIESLYTEKGYIVLRRSWESNTVIEITMDMPVEKRAAHPKVRQNLNKVAMQRGPVIYCVEQADNRDDFEKIYISKDTVFAEEFDVSMFGGVMTVTAVNPDGKWKFIPYYRWDNREPGKMKVWIPFR